MWLQFDIYTKGEPLTSYRMAVILSHLGSALWLSQFHSITVNSVAKVTDVSTMSHMIYCFCICPWLMMTPPPPSVSFQRETHAHRLHFSKSVSIQGKSPCVSSLLTTPGLAETHQFVILFVYSSGVHPVFSNNMLWLYRHESVLLLLQWRNKISRKWKSTMTKGNIWGHTGSWKRGQNPYPSKSMDRLSLEMSQPWVGVSRGCGGTISRQ